MTLPNTRHARLDSVFVARALRLPTPLKNTPFSAITTDSRKIQPGCLFVAIKGDKFDGHDFIDQAISQGASGILCSRPGTQPVPHTFQVRDAQEGYRDLGAAWRKLFDVPVVCVAGSVGKTSTKEMLAAMLRGRWPQVLRTAGSFNGYVGIPMTLLELKPEHGAAVIEVGIDEIGAMIQHMPIVSATASVLTTIGPEHLEKLVDVPTVAREEAIALREVARTGGLTVYNLDDPWIAPLFHEIQGGTRRSFTLRDSKAGADLRASYHPEGPGAVEIDGERFELPLPGAHNAVNFVTAYAVATGLGLSAAEIRQGLATFVGPEGRSQVRTLDDGTMVVLDYYNANPTSTEAGLELLSAGPKRPRWACLADMKELGDGEEAFHRGLAPRIVSLGIEHVLLHGTRMAWLEDELKKRGFAGELSRHDSHAAITERLLAGVRPGDAVLFKGSHSMRMEEAWKPFEAGLAKRK